MNHIAKEGETEYAVILRNRSGQDAGQIDYGISVDNVTRLSLMERQDLIRMAEALVRNLKRCIEAA